jgi:hypothetical protein
LNGEGSPWKISCVLKSAGIGVTAEEDVAGGSAANAGRYHQN